MKFQHADIDSALYNVFREGAARQFSRGEILVRPGLEPAGIFFIEEGLVKVYSLGSRGEEYLHLLYGVGEIFPLVWLTRDNNLRRVYYEAQTDCRVCIVAREDVRQRLKADSDAAFAFIQQVLNQFSIYADRLDNLEYKYARERLVYRLLFLASRFGEKTERGWVIKAVLTQSDLANSINMSRESVSREMERLKSTGSLYYQGKFIVLSDIEALTRDLKETVSPDYWGLL